MSYLSELRALGFDRSRYVPGTKMYRPICSACETLVIQGVPTHETGCPNKVYECFECGSMGAKRHRGLCEDCANPEPFDEDTDEGEQE